MSSPTGQDDTRRSGGTVNWRTKKYDSELQVCFDHRTTHQSRCVDCKAYRLAFRLTSLGFKYAQNRGSIRSTAPQATLEQLAGLRPQVGSPLKKLVLRKGVPQVPLPPVNHKYTFEVILSAELDIEANSEEEAREDLRFYSQGIHRLATEQIAAQPFVTSRLRKVDGQDRQHQ